MRRLVEMLNFQHYNTRFEKWKSTNSQNSFKLHFFSLYSVGIDLLRVRALFTSSLPSPLYNRLIPEQNEYTVSFSHPWRKSILSSSIPSLVTEIACSTRTSPTSNIHHLRVHALFGISLPSPQYNLLVLEQNGYTRYQILDCRKGKLSMESIQSTLT